MSDLTDRIAQAIGDPGSIVGRSFGPSWGEGNEGYWSEPETVTRWSTRAVLAVLAEAASNDGARLAIAERRVSLAQGLAEDWAGSKDDLLASAGYALLNVTGGAR